MMPPKMGNDQAVEINKPVRTKANQKSKQEGGMVVSVVVVRTESRSSRKYLACAGGLVDRRSSWW